MSSPKVTVKENLIIFHKPHEWETIHQRIIQERGPTMAISFVLKRELGFTIRSHRGLMPHAKESLELIGTSWPNTHHYEMQVHLDFFNQSAQSWFQLKYL
jgi:hypothetical protein